MSEGLPPIRLESQEEAAWMVAAVFMEAWHEDAITKARFASIEHFLRLLPLEDVLEAADLALLRIAYGRQRQFQYFCGVCWRKIRRLRGEEIEP